MNSKITIKEIRPSLVGSDGKLYVDDDKKAEVLNTFFKSVFVLENVATISDFNIGSNTTVTEVNFNREDARKQVLSLKE